MAKHVIVKINKPASSFSLSGETLRIRLMAKCSIPYLVKGRGGEIIDEICTAVENILERYAVLNERGQ